MKKIIYFLFILSSNIAFGQCLSNGITTNPSTPINNQLPSKTNLYFDWRLQNLQSNTTCQPLTSIESPFFKIDNLEILRQSKDMLPEDGWELIRRDFGYTDQNTLKPEVPEHTYFILYNKFTGILRILLKTCRGADYNGMKITIKFDATTIFQTALLDFTSSIKALDETNVKYPAAQSASIFVNDRTKWFYADFPMSYDACNCKYKSKLNIISQLIQNSTITLQGSITGTITSISNGQGSVNNNGSFSFKDFVNGADKFKKGYSSVDNFITETKNVATTIPNSSSVISALTDFQNALKNDQFLKTGLAAVPWLKAASSLLDFFSGGGKTSPQTVQLMPMAVNLSLKLNGTMQTSNQYHNITFSNPGSLNAETDPDIYPFYNESLGVFNLMIGPKFSQQYNIGTFSVRPPIDMERWRVKLQEQVKWVINPASGLTLQDAQASYVALSYDSSATPAASLGQKFDFLEGKDPISNRWEYRTEYVDINCLSLNQSFYFQAKSNSNVGRLPEKFYLKLLVNLKRTTGQNVLLVLKYPIVDGTYSNVPYSVIYNGTGTTFDPTTCLGGGIAQSTASEINTFCSSTAYTTNRMLRAVPVDNVNSVSSNKTFTISPNPASTILQITGSTKQEKIKNIQVIDLLGKEQLKYNENISGIFSKTIDISSLSSGVFFIKLTYSDGRSDTKKFIVVK